MGTKKPRTSKPSVFDDENMADVSQDGKGANATEKNNQVESENTTEEFNLQNKIEDGVVEGQDENLDKNAVGDDFNPLEGAVKKRAYASNFGAQNSVQEVDRVPEPSITNLPPPPPPSSKDSSPFMGGEGNGSGGAKGSSSSTPPPHQKLNPDMAAMPEKDARAASTMLVDAVLGGYKQFWGIAYEAVRVKDEDLVDWVMKDQISLDIKIPINANGEEADLRSVYEMFNSQSKEALTVDLTTEDFIKVREAMIREFTRRGWGISDMQYIIQHFVRDAGQRAIAVYQLRGTINNFTKSIMKSYEETKRLREELTEIKEKVEASEPSKVVKKEQDKNVVRENPRKTMDDASEFVEKFEIRKDKAAEKEPDVREVPFYEGNKEIQPKDGAEEQESKDVAVYTIVNPDEEK
jgi:hypothetical protein